MTLLVVPRSMPTVLRIFMGAGLGPLAASAAEVRATSLFHTVRGAGLSTIQAAVSPPRPAVDVSRRSDAANRQRPAAHQRMTAVPQARPAPKPESTASWPGLRR